MSKSKLKCGKLYSYRERFTLWNKPPEFFLNTDNPVRITSIPKDSYFVVLEINHPYYPNEQPWLHTKILTQEGIVGWSQLYINFLIPIKKES